MIWHIINTLLWITGTATLAFPVGIMRGRAVQMARYRKVPCIICDQRGRYAYHTVRIQNFANKCTRLPFIGKRLQQIIIGIIISFWYPQILKEGVRYGNANRNTTTT